MAQKKKHVFEHSVHGEREGTRCNSNAEVNIAPGGSSLLHSERHGLSFDWLLAEELATCSAGDWLKRAGEDASWNAGFVFASQRGLVMALPWTLLLLAATAAAAGTSRSRWGSIGALQPEAGEARQAGAVQELLERLLGPRAASAFTVSVNRSLAGPGGLDTYRLRSGAPGVVDVAGSSGVAAASGIYHYLKDFCGCHVSWSGTQLRLPESLPPVPTVISVTSPNRSGRRRRQAKDFATCIRF